MAKKTPDPTAPGRYQDVVKTDIKTKLTLGAEHKSALLPKTRRTVKLLTMITVLSAVMLATSVWANSLQSNVDQISYTAAESIDVEQFETWFISELTLQGYEGTFGGLDSLAVTSSVSQMYESILTYTLVDSSTQPTWDISPLLAYANDSDEIDPVVMIEAQPTPLPGIFNILVMLMPLFALLALGTFIPAVLIARKAGGSAATGWVLRRVGFRLLLSGGAVAGFLLWRSTSMLSQAESYVDATSFVNNLVGTLMGYDPASYIILGLVGLFMTVGGYAYKL